MLAVFFNGVKTFRNVTFWRKTTIWRRKKTIWKTIWMMLTVRRMKKTKSKKFETKFEENNFVCALLSYLKFTQVVVVF